jgi:hypothetical protein
MQAPEEKVVEEPALLDEPTEVASAASRFDYDAMLQADADAKAASQPKRGADGHLKFDADGMPQPATCACFPPLSIFRAVDVAHGRSRLFQVAS